MKCHNAYKVKKKSSTRHKLRVALFVVCVIIVALVFYYLKVVCPIIVKLSEERVRSLATSTISEVVGDVLSEEGITYSDFASVTYSADNKVEMIEVDSVQTNLIIRQITKEVQKKFDNLGHEGVKISLGTFTGIPFLYDLGPKISIQLVPVGTVNTKINSNFKSAGINQTLHQIVFVVNAGIGMVLPAKTQNFNTELEVLLCENLIIGKVPEVYLHGSLI